MESRIARWLSYADSCIGAPELARCQGFWTFVAVVLGVICVAAVVGATASVALERRRKRRAYEPPVGRR